MSHYFDTSFKLFLSRGMEHMLNIRPNLRLVLHFLEQQRIQRFQFPHQRLPRVSTRIILSPFYDLPFPKRATANFLVACGCPLLFALNRNRSKPTAVLNLGVDWIVQKKDHFPCTCIYTFVIVYFDISRFRDWFMVVRVQRQ